ncbi:Zinc finger C2H2 type domain-containing protein [Penicillium ucsense]|uniref:Zinc finger C2H2 type domain-containing protein n=1 Tax=Penicillium ucsense TaxID=2839758 RepID=A0A8J8VVL8_9EURO|nr:Zinc finger C2H2 type domain-containing protein [Penicillium ucsense]KAF7733566.1 Zinc finger C2H2 type domain-containing protein [Penicillium ucsense]
MESTPRQNRKPTVRYTTNTDGTYSSASLFASDTVFSSNATTHPPVGLGISNCGLENIYTQAAPIPYHVSYPINLTTPNHAITPTNNHLLSLQADDFCGMSCYEIYSATPNGTNTLPDDPAAQSLAVYPGFQPSFDYGHEPCMSLDKNSRLNNHWMEISTPGSMTPPHNVNSVAVPAPLDGHWSGEYLTQPGVNLQQALPVMTHSGLQPFGPPLPHSDLSRRREREAMATAALEPQNVGSGPTAMVSDYSSAKTSKRGRKPSVEKGCKCPVCGYYFTRRSNCVAHQKKHDPTYHRAIPCEECPKSFGRNADLRRHVDTVHRGIRKHVCKWCSRRYTRWENMTKHLVECKERPADARTPTPPPSSLEVECDSTNSLQIER